MFDPFFGFVVLIAIVVLAYFFRMRPPEDTPPQDTTADEGISRKRLPRKPRPTVNSFDKAHSKPVQEKRVLNGAAWVTDGDTIKIQKTQIRLFGIDAPEMNHPYGKKAKWALHALCKGQEIRAEITDVDDHGRTVAKCFLPDGRDLSAEMVKLGLAIDWPKFSGGHYLQYEVEDARKKMFLADARQKGRMHVWKNFEDKQKRS